MDPLSLTASCIAILQLSGAIINCCYDYRSRVKSAAKDASRIVNELNSLRSIIETLFVLLEDEAENKPSERSALKELARESGPLEECKVELEALVRILEPKAGWKAAKAKIFWPLKESDVKRVLQTIDGTKSTLQLALAADQRRAALVTQGGIESIARQVSANNANDRRDKIFQWLSATNSLASHTIARKKCQSMTGLWALEEETFKRWSVFLRTFLWIYGIPGCGKTILCSTIIDALSRESQASQDGVLAYFYFDFNDNEKSKVETLIRSLIAQLYVQKADTPEVLDRLFSRNQDGAFQPPLADLLKVLPEMLNSFATVCIVVDALDECVEMEELLQVLHEIQSWEINHLHIIVTSRDLTEISTSLSSVITGTISVQGSAVNNDISLYIAERLKRDPKLANWPSQVREMISRTLNEGARGMFRLVACQLDALRNCYNIRDLKRELDTLPKTLEETYEQILLRIDENHRDSALRILQWLSFAARPVTVHEASEVLAINLSDQPCYDPDLKLLDPRDIMLLCSTLITRSSSSADDDPEVEPTYDEYSFGYDDSEVIRLAHLSVKDYLLSNRIKTSKASFFATDTRLANIAMAQTCLVYLLRPAFAPGHCEWDDLITRLDEWPLYHYAAHFWPFHVKASGDDLDDKIWLLLHQFFNTRDTSGGGNFVAWAVALTPDINSTDAKQTHPLYYAASFGITSVIRKLLDSDPSLEINAPGGRFCSSPLQVAGYRDHPAAVEMLLEAKADPMAVNCQRESCLFWAVLRQHKEVQRLLEDHGARWTSTDASLLKTSTDTNENLCYDGGL